MGESGGPVEEEGIGRGREDGETEGMKRKKGH